MRFFTWFLLLSLLSVSGYSAPLQCVYLPKLVELFFKHHYQYGAMTDELKKHAVEQFIRRVDPLKMFLLQSDVDRIRAELPVVFETAKQDNCKAVLTFGPLFAQRAQENEDFVREFLGKNYVLDEKTELELDPKVREFSKTLEEKKGLLSKVIHFEVSSLLLADVKLPEVKKRLVHRYELSTKRLKERDLGDHLEDLVEAFALGLDPHSSYLSYDDLQDFEIQMGLSLEGIGATLSSQDGFVVIEALIPGGSADQTGKLKPKDKIIMVGQENQASESVIDMPLREVVKKIRGKKGTKVRLSILRQTETTENFEITIVRDKIDIKESAAKITYLNKTRNGKDLKLGLIDLPSFYGGGDAGSRYSSQDLRKLLKEATDKKVDGIVLDVSRNGGGLLEEAVRISGFFLKSGGMVATNGQDRKVDILRDPDSGILYAGPLVLLTSRISASASEILAGALRDYRRAVVVGGDHTFGKGTVQSVNRLPPGLGAIKVTVGQFFLPGGQSTQQLGVSSNVVTPTPFDSDDIGEKYLDYSLPPNSVKPFVTADANGGDSAPLWKPIDEKTIQSLVSLSETRVSKDPKFVEMKKKTQERSKNKGIVKLAEIRKKYKEELKSDKKKEKKSDKNADKKKLKIRDAEELAEYLESPSVQESLNILADYVAMVSLPASAPVKATNFVDK